ncbi:MAG: ATP-binding protein [Clostridia bacterium]|nr:ATP-binding protein [Clostridia bacterium]
MRSDIIRELNAEYDRQRAINAQEETLRREKAAVLCPEIPRLEAERDQLIFGGIRGVLTGRELTDDIPARMDVINRRIRSLLLQNGLAEDYLEPVYSCRKCRDTGYCGEPVKEMCDCFRTKFFTRLYQRMGLGSAQEQTFERFDPDVFPDTPMEGRGFSQRDVMQMYLKRCRDWAENYPDNDRRTVVFMGQSGLGKTYLMHCMTKRLLEKGVNALLISAFSFLDTARRAYFSGKTEDMDTLLDADVLLIDDMGSEPLMENITIVQWFNLINERQTRGKATVVTTNLMENELRERYTERVASRLLNNEAMVLHFIGEDVRRRTSP